MIAIILAGGSGTRFWPLSRKQRPKQLISLWAEETMIEATVDRLEGISSREKTFVVLGEHLVEPTRAVLPDIEFIVEPCPRNTAPAIGLAAVWAQHHFGDEPMGVFPADHAIGGPQGAGLGEFRRCLLAAKAQAEAGHIVTLGINPTSPETGYGYIHYDATGAAEASAELSAYPVREFVEKPSRELAERYVASGDYAWNSGMFIFKPSVLLKEMKRQLPEMYEAMMKIADALGTPQEQTTINERFSALRGVSVDYGIMEGARDVVVIPATFQWSDVGHWAAVDQVGEVDAAGNIVDAEALLVDVKDSVVYSRGSARQIAVLGVEGLVVVDTPDALLVIPRDRAQDVRQIVAQLQREGREELL